MNLLDKILLTQDEQLGGVKARKEFHDMRDKIFSQWEGASSVDRIGPFYIQMTGPAGVGQVAQYRLTREFGGLILERMVTLPVSGAVVPVPAKSLIMAQKGPQVVMVALRWEVVFDRGEQSRVYAALLSEWQEGSSDKGQIIGSVDVGKPDAGKRD